MQKAPKIIPISDLHVLEILKILAQGEKDIEAGVGFDLEEVMAEAKALLAEQP